MLTRDVARRWFPYVRRPCLPNTSNGNQERQKIHEGWHRWPIVGGVGNGVTEKEQGKDLNSSAAAMQGLLTMWFGNGLGHAI